MKVVSSAMSLKILPIFLRFFEEATKLTKLQVWQMHKETN